VARSSREAPEIDGVINVPAHLPVGTFQSVTVTGVAGPDLDADPAGEPAATRALNERRAVRA